MNEPDEEQESHVPEEPLPERDGLLEALVDQETEAAPRRRISKTLIAAFLLTGFGVWQIVHVSNGGEPLFRLAPKAMTGPTKLRSDSRRPIGKVLPSTDPIAAYLERAKRGMTDQEIRWMIEDFQTAGLDQEDHSLKGILRAKQQLWYLEALTEALQLSPDQKAEAKARMDTQLVMDIDQIQKIVAEDIARYPAITPDLKAAIESTYVPMDVPWGTHADWLIEEPYAPWNVCELKAEQSQLTLQKWRSKEKREAKENDMVNTGSTDPFFQIENTSWVRLKAIEIQDPVSGNLIELPQIEVSPADAVNGTIQDDINISDAFPLTPDQKLADHRYDPLAQARLLQPAQLRMGLLLDRGLVDDLLKRLDSPTTQQTSNSDPGVILEKPEALPTITTTPTDDLTPNTVEPETPVDLEETKAVE